MWKMVKSEGLFCLWRVSDLHSQLVNLLQGTGARMLGMAPATGFGFTFFELVKSYSKLRPDEIALRNSNPV